jgi:hypothetical protein
MYNYEQVGRDSEATLNGLDGPGSNPGEGEIFRTRPDRPWNPHSLLYNGYRVSFLGVKQQGRGIWLPKERVELYLHSCSRVTFTTSRFLSFTLWV